MSEFPSEYVVEAAHQLRVNASARLMGIPREMTSVTGFRRQVAVRDRTRPRLYRVTQKGSLGNPERDTVTIEVLNTRRTPTEEVGISPGGEYGPFPIFGPEEILAIDHSMESLRRFQHHPNVIQGIASGVWQNGEDMQLSEFEKAAHQARGEG